MRTLVTGATGFVGSQLVPELCATGHDVSVLVRDAERYEPSAGVTVFEGDLLEPGSFEDALEGIDVAYYLVHSMGSGAGFEERDRRAAHNFERAASAAGVDRIVYLSGLGDDSDRLSEHLRSRREVEAILADGTAELTVLRAAIVVGDGSASFQMIRQLVKRLPVMVTPRWVQTPCQPIAVDDVIAYLVGILDVPETAGETYEIGGPNVLTYREMLVTTARVFEGRAPTIVPVPVLSPRLSAYWVDLVTDVPASVAHPLIEGLENPVVVTDPRIERLVPVELTPFETAVRRVREERSTAAAEGGVDELERPPADSSSSR